jgi:hypothetical protein
MNIPVAETTPPPLQPPSPPAVIASLEAVEIELELSRKEIGEEQYESTVRETVEAFCGVLLFHMRIEREGVGHLVAAIALESAEGREIAIIDLPCNGESASVIPASESDLPIARIAPAYASLADCWATAA